MMFKQLDKQQQNRLALGLLVAMFILVLQTLLVPVFSSMNQYNEEIKDLRFKLQKYQQAVDAKPVLKKQLEELESTLDDAQLFQSNIAPGIAAAALQKKIRRIIERVGGDFISTRVLPEQTVDKLTRIAINVRLTGVNSILKDLLYEIEASKPLLLIDKLSLVGSTPSRNIAANQRGLIISMEVVTYISQTERK